MRASLAVLTRYHHYHPSLCIIIVPPYMLSSSLPTHHCHCWSLRKVGEGIVIIIHPSSLLRVEGRQGRQAMLSIPHIKALSSSSLSLSSGGGLVGHWSSTTSVIVCGRWARWAKASTFVLEANRKGHGGKVSASVRVSLSLSVPHILTLSLVIV